MIPRTLGAALTVAAILGGAACTVTLPVGHEALTPKAVETARQYPYSVRIAVSGGADAVAFGSPFVISDQELKTAIEGAISSSRLFRSVVGDGEADFALSARVTTLNKRLYGTDLELEIGWSLMRIADRQTVMRRSIVTKASTRDRTESEPAMRAAVAQAGRENIAQALKTISELGL